MKNILIYFIKNTQENADKIRIKHNERQKYYFGCFIDSFCVQYTSKQCECFWCFFCSLCLIESKVLSHISFGELETKCWFVSKIPSTRKYTCISYCKLSNLWQNYFVFIFIYLVDSFYNAHVNTLDCTFEV